MDLTPQGCFDCPPTVYEFFVFLLIGYLIAAAGLLITTRANLAIRFLGVLLLLLGCAWLGVLALSSFFGHHAGPPVWSDPSTEQGSVLLGLFFTFAAGGGVVASIWLLRSFHRS